jgi:hypothetical protein
MQLKTDAEVQPKILEAGITLTAINNFETKAYNPQPTTGQQPRVEPKPTPVLSTLPQLPDETAQQVAAPHAKKALVPKDREGKKKSWHMH